MALDQNAGQKRTVSLMRNLTAPTSPEPSAAPIAPSIPQTPIAPPASKPAIETKNSPGNSPTLAQAPYANRTKKISFLADPKLEERFKKARLRAGFEKLEDAYNEAVIVFCEQVEKGMIDRF